jgi:hypothetical protein
LSQDSELVRLLIFVVAENYRWTFYLSDDRNINERLFPWILISAKEVPSANLIKYGRRIYSA